MMFKHIFKYNKCHLPARSPNSTGGRFCSTDGKATSAQTSKPTPVKSSPSAKTMSLGEMTKQFMELGISIHPYAIEDWHKRMKISPMESLTKIFGLTEEEVKERIKARNKNKLTNLMIFSGNGGKEFKVVADGKVNGVKAYIELGFDFDKKVGNIEYLKLTQKQQQGAGAGKHFVKTFVEAFKEAGMLKVDLQANIDVGGYAWAKYGWVPKRPHKARDEFNGRFTEVEFEQNMPVESAKVVKNILNYKQLGWDAHFVYGLSDLKDWGKKIMLGSEWDATLDFKDKRAMDRYEAYVGN